MTPYDWLDLLEEAAPRLAGQGWHWNELQELRNEAGRCPLCALAALHGCERYYLAWKWAIEVAFGCAPVEALEAFDVAMAADSRQLLSSPDTLFIHRRLVQLFGDRGYAQRF